MLYIPGRMPEIVPERVPERVSERVLESLTSRNSPEKSSSAQAALVHWLAARCMGQISTLLFSELFLELCPRLCPGLFPELSLEFFTENTRLGCVAPNIYVYIKYTILYIIYLYI